jgi:hypothetical protein
VRQLAAAFDQVNAFTREMSARKTQPYESPRSRIGTFSANVRLGV